VRSGEREALEAAAAIHECRRLLVRSGSSIVAEATGIATAANGAIAEWRHYPEGEAYDPRSHAQYFFHRHPVTLPESAEHAAEAGHFHLFQRAEGMPRGVAPLLLPELAVANAPVAPQAAPLKRGARDEVSHLVAIAVDAAGEPVRLFTTNRWVTGETWYGASDVIRMVERFTIAGDEPSFVLNRWISAIVQLFRPEIAVLLRQRDDSIMAWRRRRRTNVFEDPRLEITSTFDIDLDARLAAAERLGTPPPHRTAPEFGTRLPPMAEGWGV
jgi:uncharacterized protein DUF6969